MLGPRVTGPRLLKHLTPRTSATARSLHMTGKATAPRLSSMDKPVAAQFQEPSQPTKQTAKPTRQFNTSRTLKRVNDSSTIDFAYLPTFPVPVLAHDSTSSAPRVPILPHVTSAQAAAAISSSSAQLPQTTQLLGPTISTVAADSTHIHAPSSMSEIHDGAGHHATDFHDVLETLSGVRDAARMVTLGLEREADQQAKQAKGILKTVWTGLVQDVLGSQKAGGAATAKT